MLVGVLVRPLIRIGFLRKTAEVPVLHKSKLKRCHQYNETRSLVFVFDFQGNMSVFIHKYPYTFMNKCVPGDSCKSFPPS